MRNSHHGGRKQKPACLLTPSSAGYCLKQNPGSIFNDNYYCSPDSNITEINDKNWEGLSNCSAVQNCQEFVLLFFFKNWGDFLLIKGNVFLKCKNLNGCKDKLWPKHVAAVTITWEGWVRYFITPSFRQVPDYTLASIFYLFSIIVIVQVRKLQTTRHLSQIRVHPSE